MGEPPHEKGARSILGSSRQKEGGTSVSQLSGKKNGAGKVMMQQYNIRPIWNCFVVAQLVGTDEVTSPLLLCTSVVTTNIIKNTVTRSSVSLSYNVVRSRFIFGSFHPK